MSTRTNIIQALRKATDELVAVGIQHTPSWKRVFYPIPAEEVLSVMRLLEYSGLSKHLEGKKDMMTDALYEWKVPRDISISLEEFVLSHESDRTRWVNYDLNFQYVAADKRELVRDKFLDEEALFTYSIRVGINLYDGKDQAEITSYVFAPEYSETGYEGHAWSTVTATENELATLLWILAQYTKNPVVEKPLEEQFKEIVLEDSKGDRLFYNQQTKEWDLSEKDFLSK